VAEAAQLARGAAHVHSCFNIEFVEGKDGNAGAGGGMAQVREELTDGGEVGGETFGS
jgi:hypothetical protein